jgi:prevent-host-death family protein
VFVDSNRKGNVAELAIAKEAADLGLSVLKPLTEHERYDLVLGIGGRLFRVQCKWGAHHGDVITVRLNSCYHSPTRGYVIGAYDPSEIDLFAVHCGDLGRSYLLPVELGAGRRNLHLRLRPTKNNQRAALNWAAEYEFRGAVAQLEERSDGIRKAEGSSPSSSTRRISTEAPPPEEVGAHEFRNHFGYYMERAAAGADVFVRRRGKPYVRMGPLRPRVRLKSACPSVDE